MGVTIFQLPLLEAMTTLWEIQEGSKVIKTLKIIFPCLSAP